jgi:DNA-binding response OmpR family regulator
MNACLIMDPCAELLNTATLSLQRLGMACDVTRCTEAFAYRKHYDVVLMDMRACADFHDMFRRVQRHAGQAYVIAVVEARDVVDRVLALEMGADAVIVAPCGSDEIAARVRSLLRRQAQAHSTDKPVAHARLNVASRTLTMPGQMPLTLSGSEAVLLQQLAARPGHIMSRAELLSRSGLARMGHPVQTVELLVSHLRRKLLSLNLQTSPIRTVRGQGYAWSVSVLQLVVDVTAPASSMSFNTMVSAASA